jgi:hypothetical protein
MSTFFCRDGHLSIIRHEHPMSMALHDCVHLFPFFTWLGTKSFHLLLHILF